MQEVRVLEMSPPEAAGGGRESLQLRLKLLTVKGLMPSVAGGI